MVVASTEAEERCFGSSPSPFHQESSRKDHRLTLIPLQTRFQFPLHLMSIPHLHIPAVKFEKIGCGHEQEQW